MPADTRARATAPTRRGTQTLTATGSKATRNATKERQFGRTRPPRDVPRERGRRRPLSLLPPGRPAAKLTANPERRPTAEKPCSTVPDPARPVLSHLVPSHLSRAARQEERSPTPPRALAGLLRLPLPIAAAPPAYGTQCVRTHGPGNASARREGAAHARSGALLPPRARAAVALGRVRRCLRRARSACFPPRRSNVKRRTNTNLKHISNSLLPKS